MRQLIVDEQQWDRSSSTLMVVKGIRFYLSYDGTAINVDGAIGSGNLTKGELFAGLYPMLARFPGARYVTWQRGARSNRFRLRNLDHQAVKRLRASAAVDERDGLSLSGD